MQRYALSSYDSYSMFAWSLKCSTAPMLLTTARHAAVLSKAAVCPLACSLDCLCVLIYLGPLLYLCATAATAGHGACSTG
eukprot:4367-Heterococcus_DN1.PRE.4